MFIFFRCSEKSSKTSNKVIERDDLIERIRAQNRIKWLLAEENRNCRFERFADCKTEALNLALKYEFVTPLTSLIVEESNEYISDGKLVYYLEDLRKVCHPMLSLANAVNTHTFN